MASGKLSFTENLIENVKKYPIIFDDSHPQHRNLRTKNKKWDEIAISLNVDGMDGDTLRKKWKNLRDCYAKHLRSEMIGQDRNNISRYKAWPWAQQMESFRPFITFAKKHSNVTYLDAPSDSITCRDNDIRNNEQHTSEISEIYTPSSINIDKETTETDTKTIDPGASVSAKKRKKIECANSEQSTGVDKIVDYLENMQSTNTQEKPDEIDKIFNAYAASVRKLSRRRQTIIKFQIAEIIMKAELEQQSEENSTLVNSSSYVESPQYYTDASSMSSQSTKSWFGNLEDKT